MLYSEFLSSLEHMCKLRRHKFNTVVAFLGHSINVLIKPQFIMLTVRKRKLLN